ncbi:hypothetical protein [Vulcanisaeta thermophila]|uniref:hypothetical protein n=1 Tax=Vulcanisaeta thermophila TaxID=867917 RepID=UPI000852C505|nr:hypothetical protein [Vulcanisaeta thermophila]
MSSQQEYKVVRSGRGGWEIFRPLNFDRVMTAIQRVSGIYMVLWLYPRPWFVIAWHSWSALLAFDETPLGKVLAALFIVFFIIHGLNGLRIMAIEYGIISGRPIRHPINPKPALRQSRLNRAYIIFMIVVGIVGSIYAIYILLYGIIPPQIPVSGP